MEFEHESGFGFEKLNFNGMLNRLSELIYYANKKKGFYEDCPPAFTIEKECVEAGLNYPDVEYRRKQWQLAYLGNKIMLMVGELAEAHEGLRHNNPASEHIPEFSALEEEMADTIIRILDFCGYQKLRIEEAINAKLDYNATRPHKHGKQF